MLDLYRTLIGARRKVPALYHLSNKHMEVRCLEKDRLVWMRRWHKKSQVFCVFNFNPEDKSVKAILPPGRWKKDLDSSDETWAGPGSSLPQTLASGNKINMRPFSFALYKK